MAYLDLESIATDSDLANEFGGVDRLDRAMPVLSDRDDIRLKALEDVEAAIKSRTPPIWPSSLSDPKELRDAVVYRSLVRICRSARTGFGDFFDTLAKDYDREYKAAVNRSFTVTGGVQGPTGFTFEFERR